MSLNMVPRGISWDNDQPAKQRLRRWTVRMPGIVWIVEYPHSCPVRDISPAGACVHVDELIETAVGAMVEFELNDFPMIPSEVCHGAGNTLGLMFLHAEEQETEFARYLVINRPPRLEPRETVGLQASITSRKSRKSCVVTNISRMGAKLVTNDISQLSLGGEIELFLDGFGEINAVIRRISEGEVGVVFQKAIIGELPA